jgi:glycosyltransferase involved in cell wall biosynthesis
MRCGVPVVASDAGSLPEVLGDAARLVAPHDPDALTDALRELTDPAADEARNELVVRGEARAARYSWRTTATKMVELYRRLR